MARSAIALGNVKELFVAVDPGLAPFQQIMDQLRRLIECGELCAGDRLPTVRQLAGDLGVAPNTVARAYAELQDEGWLMCEGRRGTLVAAGAPTHKRTARMHSLQEEVAEFMATLLRRGHSAAEISTVLRRFVQ